MVNRYKQFALRDLEEMIRTIVMDSMMVPLVLGNPERHDEIMDYNTMVAMYNDGLRNLADQLINRLNTPDESDCTDHRPDPDKDDADA